MYSLRHIGLQSSCFKQGIKYPPLASRLMSIDTSWDSSSKNYDGLYIQGAERVLFGDGFLNSDRFR